MTYIVHWKEVVGSRNLDAFLRVQTNILNKDEPGTIDKYSPEIAAMYRSKRALMRHCGYEEDNGIVRFHGWVGSYRDGPEIKFRTTAGPFREYISMSVWMDYYKGLEQAGYERQYYGPNVVQAAIDAARDDNFIEEVG